jgi:hypothetical protein
MKKILLPLGIGLAGLLICVGLLFFENNKLSKQLDDFENGKEPEEEPETVPEPEPEQKIIMTDGTEDTTKTA